MKIASKIKAAVDSVWDGTETEKQLHDITGDNIKRRDAQREHYDRTSYADQIKAAVEAVEKRLEKDIPKTLALLKEVNNSPEKTTLARRTKEAVLKRVGKHWFEIQQGLPVVPWQDANAQAEEKQRRKALPKSRAERIAFLKALVEQDAPVQIRFGTVPVFTGRTPHQLAASPRDLALLNETVKDELAICVREFRKYEIVRQEMEVHLDPVLAEELARDAIAAARTPEELDAARAAYTSATEGRKGQAGAAAVDSARTALHCAGEAPRAALIDVLESVKGALEAALIDAKLVEGEFFLDFGMKWIATPVSARFATAHAAVERLLAELIAGPHVGTSYQPIFNPNATPVSTWLHVNYDE